MKAQIELGDITINVDRKDIKNVHLSVHPPKGRVTISAPARMSLNTIRVFAVAKMAWIRQQQKKITQQRREAPLEILNRETHYVWGDRYLLRVVEADLAPVVKLTGKRFLLQARPGTDLAARREILDSWYRSQVRQAVPGLIAKYERVMGVKVNGIFVQTMRTKWGSCNPKARTLRLNTDLAKKPRECLEYIVVHEMTHILEPSHNEHFLSLMDRVIPAWRSYRQTLTELPVRHEDWQY